ncbi:hypothetical protein BD324DRAFT_654138 [Kockovaella imperatae]|uniref:Uncharacterized protein n=1 Tax=Kockovaella imperatae TaxID=4999 RepID=A0A1Y1U7A9_9TREE|nr:hypothetical protein BD324DRAFT_654138 [Kockovaella imperatae]ORX33424.1 hypothetical protein BD324DRAFT_654138 [Kockovaella imperatae]
MEVNSCGKAPSSKPAGTSKAIRRKPLVQRDASLNDLLLQHHERKLNLGSSARRHPYPHQPKPLTNNEDEVLGDLILDLSTLPHRWTEWQRRHLAEVESLKRANAAVRHSRDEAEALLDHNLALTRELQLDWTNIREGHRELEARLLRADSERVRLEMLVEEKDTRIEEQNKLIIGFEKRIEERGKDLQLSHECRQGLEIELYYLGKEFCQVNLGQYAQISGGPWGTSDQELETLEQLKDRIVELKLLNKEQAGDIRVLKQRLGESVTSGRDESCQPVKEE